MKLIPQQALFIVLSNNYNHILLNKSPVWSGAPIKTCVSTGWARRGPNPRRPGQTGNPRNNPVAPSPSGENPFLFEEQRGELVQVYPPVGPCVAARRHVESVLQPVVGQYLVQRLGRFKEEVRVAARQPVELVARLLQRLELVVDGVVPVLLSHQPHAERADVAEEPGVHQRGGDGVAASHGEAGYGPGSRPGVDPVPRLDVGDYVLDDALGVEVAHHARPGGASVEPFLWDHQRPGGHLRGVAVGHDAQHGLGQPLLYEVVEYLAGPAHGAPSVLIAAGAVQKVKHGVLRLGVVGVAVGGVDEHAALHAQRRGIVPNLLKVAPLVGLVIVLRHLSGDQQHAEITGTVPLHDNVARVVDGDAIDVEAVGVKLAGGGRDGDRPYPVLSLDHVDGASRPGTVEPYRVGVRGRHVESDLRLADHGGGDPPHAHEVPYLLGMGAREDKHAYN